MSENAKPAKKWGWRIAGGGMVVLVLLIVFRPQMFRTPFQVPVSVSVRPSYVGVGNVVVIKNNSRELLENVLLTGTNRSLNQTAQYRVGTIRPGETIEVGWTKWAWKVAPGETLTVSNDRYFSIVFTAE